MATYMELRSLFGHSDLENKVEVAIIIAAEAIRNEDAGTVNHANRLIWAKKALDNTNAYSKQMLKVLLAGNKTISTATIIGATDATIQAAVDAAVNVFADGT